MIDYAGRDTDIMIKSLASEAGRGVISLMLSRLSKPYSGTDPVSIARNQALNTFAHDFRFRLAQASPSGYYKLRKEEADNEYRRRTEG